MLILTLIALPQQITFNFSVRHKNNRFETV